MRVNTRYINSTRGTYVLKKGCHPVAYNKKTLFGDVITKGRPHNIVIIVAPFINTIQYNNTLLILKKEIQLSAFDKYIKT